jgi:hypothetical protein
VSLYKISSWGQPCSWDLFIPALRYSEAMEGSRVHGESGSTWECTVSALSGLCQPAQGLLTCDIYHVVITVSSCMSIFGRWLRGNIGTYLEGECVTAQWWCGGDQLMGPHYVALLRRISLSVTHIHMPTHTQTHSSTLSFLGAWSWGKRMFWWVGWTTQMFRREETHCSR